jgi:hypothetical protein
VREHRDMIGRKVTLEPKDAKGRVFEVTLTTRMVGRRQSALLFGTGWREFRSESRVREGDLLIFALVGSSQFVVYILRGHIEIAKRAMASLSTTPHPPARESSRKKRKTSLLQRRISTRTSNGGCRPTLSKAEAKEAAAL